MQGFVHRPGDARFAGRDAAGALEAALADAECLMVNRNAGAGTRVLIDRLLDGRAAGRLHAISRARTTRSRPRWRRGARTGASRSSRWRELYGLGFLPIAPEDYDFLLVESRRAASGGRRPSSRRCAIRSVRDSIRALGMRPADA